MKQKMPSRNEEETDDYNAGMILLLFAHNNYWTQFRRSRKYIKTQRKELLMRDFKGVDARIKIVLVLDLDNKLLEFFEGDQILIEKFILFIFLKKLVNVSGFLVHNLIQDLDRNKDVRFLILVMNKSTELNKNVVNRFQKKFSL